MSSPIVPVKNDRVRVVESFEELVATPFSRGVNALCWARSLAGDFGEVVEKLNSGNGIMTLDEEILGSLELGKAGRVAVEEMLRDHRLLSQRGLLPELNCIQSYPREEQPGVVATDVYSFHADSATEAADTWLCTYYGSPSEGLFNDDAIRQVDQPKNRAELLNEYGGEDDEGFAEFLSDHCYDLHYAAKSGAVPYSFGVGNLWRIAVEYPGCEVPPCIHRAPETLPGDVSRLLLIS